MGDRVPAALALTRPLLVKLARKHFTGGGRDVAFGQEGVTIRAEGPYRKFVDRVGQITFSPTEALRTGRQVLYVTERAVFQGTPDGLALLGIAPGIDLERDVLAHIDWKPIIDKTPRLMDPSLFAPEVLGLSL